MAFKNKPTELFYNFLRKIISEEKFTLTEIADRLGKYISNPNVLLHTLSSGKSSVTVEMILISEEHFGLNPCSLFEGGRYYRNGEHATQVNEDAINYTGIINNQLQQIRELQNKIAELTGAITEENKTSVKP